MSHNFIMLIDISSKPWAFLGSNERIMLEIFSPVISTLDSEELHLETGFGKTLSLEINEHYSTKVIIKNICFGLKVGNEHSIFQ